MEGLEASIIAKSRVTDGTSTERLDAEYFKKKYLEDERHISEHGDMFKSASDLRLRVDASAFYPSIEEFYGSGDLPFYRVGDVDGIIDETRALRIPEELCAKFPTLKRVAEGDILFTKGGAIDRVGYVKSAGAASRDLIFLDTSRLSETERLCLFSYFRSDIFKRLLTRSSSQTAQAHLTIMLVRELPLFVGSEELGRRTAAIVNAAYEHLETATTCLANADDTLLFALGLANWAPPEPLAYVARASDAMVAGRLDAQYFRPLFSEVQDRLQATGRAVALGAILNTAARGRQPEYAEAGLPVINSKHVRANRVTLDDNRNALQGGSPIVIQTGDVLLNGTGVGTIGRAAAYLHAPRALPDNHVTVLRTSVLDPLYLAVFLNSPLGQWQIERHIKGSSGQIELYPDDIKRIMVWDAPPEIQASIRQSILSAFDQTRRATHLLDAAKRAVETAIEDGEPAALAYLKQVEEAV